MIGKQFGPWVLEWELGRGSMASVWLARAEPPPEGHPPVVAVKVLSAEVAGYTEVRTRCLRASRASASGGASLIAARGARPPGPIAGTAAYVSPEQAAGKPATKRSDLYALGVVLYQMLTGRTPFQGETLDLLHKQRYAQPERPARLVPDLPPDLDNLVCQLLENDPQRRPADAHFVPRALERLRGKQERKASAAAEVSAEDPAKLMSRLIRTELEAEKRGGPVKRLFNRPIVVIPLFLLCLGLLIWLLWPSGPATLYGRGEALMQSGNPDHSDKTPAAHLHPPH